MKIFKKFKVYADEEFYEDTAVVVAKERIEKIIKIDELESFIYNVADEEIEIIDGKGNYLVPGFIDIHIHGANGHDVMDGSTTALGDISRTIASSGVTGYLATTMTMGKEKILTALDKVREYMNNDSSKYTGAEILGVHLEGPFINPEKKGAQNSKHIKKPNVEFIKNHLDVIKLVTFAPELDEDFSFTKEMVDKGIKLSIGHSNSDYETCKCAFDHGVKNITHCFNGMSGFNHREPGVVGAALILDFNTEIIADLIHTHEDVLKLLLKAKTNKRINIITDSMRANYLAEGEYELGGQNVVVKDGRVLLEDGTLAGSVSKLNNGVKNFISATDITLGEALPMVTKTPAQTIGVYNEYGSIEPGKYASLVILDSQINVKSTYVRGQMVFREGESS